MNQNVVASSIALLSILGAHARMLILAICARLESKSHRECLEESLVILMGIELVTHVASVGRWHVNAIPIDAKHAVESKI